MPRIKILGLAFVAVLAVGVAGTGAASAVTPGTITGATAYKFCVKRGSKLLPPGGIPRGCHKDLLVSDTTDTWEVPGEPGWSGSYSTTELGNSGEQVTYFEANSASLCTLLAIPEANGYSGGEIFLAGPHPHECVAQNVVWYTKAVRSHKAAVSLVEAF